MKEVSVHMLRAEQIIAPCGPNFIRALSLSTSLHLREKDHLTYEKYWDGVHVPNPQHLYFTTDEEIKGGDWFLSDERNNIHENNATPVWVLLQCTSVENGWIKTKTKGIGYNSTWTRRICSTSNPELWTKKPIEDAAGHFENKPLPKVPQSFIGEYIDSQGSIKKVMLEEIDEATGSGYKDYKMVLRLNSHGEVIIHHPKEKTYSRGEMLHACKNAFNRIIDLPHDTMFFPEWEREWFDKHYPK